MAADTVRPAPVGHAVEPGASRTAAVVPAEIQYQGFLTDQAGDPLTGMRDLTFQLWDDAIGGSQLGSDIVISGVPVDNGMFAVALPVPAVHFGGGERWLRVAVDGQWLDPRQALRPVPYALGLRPGASVAGQVTMGSAFGAHNTDTGQSAFGVIGTASDAAIDLPFGRAGLLGIGHDAGVLGMATGLQSTGGSFSGVRGVYGSGSEGAGGEFDSDPGPGVLGSSVGGYGVHGTSQTQYGVFGQSAGGFAAGVGGQGATGVFGAGAVVGVVGDSQIGEAGVRGSAAADGARGVRGTAGGYYAVGVEGEANLGTGVVGKGEVGVLAQGSVGAGLEASGPTGGRFSGTAGDGVVAESAGGDTAAAVRGVAAGEAAGGRFESGAGVGLHVRGHEGIHVEDTSGTMFGLHAYSSGSSAVYGLSETSSGVFGESKDGNGVRASGAGGGADRAALYSINTNAASGMAAYLVNSSAFGTAHLSNGGTGEVIVLQGNGGRFLRAVDQSWDAKFRLEGNGQAYADGSWNAGGADFAEMLPATAGLEPGDVLVIGPGGLLIRSTRAEDPAVAGVRSTAPGFVGGATEDPAADLVPLAVVGVVPVKVSAENGPIAAGDLLVTAALPGHAMRAGPSPAAGTVIGKALGGLPRGTGVIRMLATLQ